MKACERCKYFRKITTVRHYHGTNGKSMPVTEQRAGECRKYPPVVVNIFDRAFPIVSLYDWCGEFKETSLV